MESLFAKILIFVHLMEMYDNTTKKLSANTTLKMYELCAGPSGHAV